MKRAWFLGVIAASLLAAACSTDIQGAVGARSPSPAPVVIDLGATRQTIEGFGASSRTWADPHLADADRSEVPADAQSAILDALFRDLGLTRLRPMLEQGIEPENDNADPGSFVPSQFNFSGKRNDSQVSLVKQAMAAGATTFFPSPVTIEPWMNEHNPQEYVEWAMAILLRWRDLGVEPPYYSPINEPGFERAGNRSPEWLTSVVKLLGARMRAEGLETRLVIPDDLNPSEAYRRAVVVLADPEARQYVGAVAYHLYGGSNDLDRLRELAQANKLPMWMTEYYESSYAGWPGVLGWAVTMQQMLTDGDATAVDYLWGFFGSHDPSSTLVSIAFDHGRYVRHERTPAYFVTGQFSRFVPPGSVRLTASAVPAPVFVSAFRRPDGKVAIVAVNSGDSARDVGFSVLGAQLRGGVEAIRTSAGEQGVRLDPLTASSSGFDASLAPESVNTFVVSLS